MRYLMGMIPEIPRLPFLLAGLSAVLIHSASAAPVALDRAHEVARSAGFSVPESYLPVAVSAPQGVPAASPQAPAQGAREKTPDEKFEDGLLIMALEPVDEAFCDGKLGARNPRNEAAYRACKVTRNFLWFIREDPKGVAGLFPPSADIKYCRTPAEKKELFDRLQ